MPGLCTAKTERMAVQASAGELLAQAAQQAEGPGWDARRLWQGGAQHLSKNRHPCAHGTSLMRSPQTHNPDVWAGHTCQSRA